MENRGSSPEPENHQVCCLVLDGKKCQKIAGNASFNKRLQKVIDAKGLDINIDINTQHIYICDFHKSMITKISNGKKWKKLIDDYETDNAKAELMWRPEFFNLPMKSLRRYKKHFNIQARPGLTKTQLAELVGDHFQTIPVCEKETISYFIYKCKIKKTQSIE